MDEQLKTRIANKFLERTQDEVLVKDEMSCFDSGYYIKEFYMEYGLDPTDEELDRYVQDSLDYCNYSFPNIKS